MRLIGLLSVFISMSVRQQLAHRADAIFQLLVTLLNISAGIGTVWIVYTQTESIAGWEFTEVIVLIGLFYMSSGILEAFIEPNLAWFSGKVREGHLDDILIRPIPPIFSASLTECQPWAFSQIILGGSVAAVGVGKIGEHSANTIGMFVVALIIAVAAIWATRLVSAATAFWMPYFEPDVLYTSLWQLGRYPIGIYPSLISKLITFVLPIALFVNVPARAITGRLSWQDTLIFVAVGVAVVVVALSIWVLGVRRYTSATS